MYVIIHSAAGYFKDKYLITDSTEEYEEVFLGLYQKLKQSMVEKNYFVKKNYARIGVNTDDGAPLNKPLKFPTLAITIRSLLQEGEKLYPKNLFR